MRILEPGLYQTNSLQCVQVAMYERELGFANTYGCVFQECISKSPMHAIERMQPIILLGTMLGFLHKCVLAFFMGQRYACFANGYRQLSVVQCRYLSRMLTAAGGLHTTRTGSGWIRGAPQASAEVPH
jgi:hypothetical protein